MICVRSFLHLAGIVNYYYYISFLTRDVGNVTWSLCMRNEQVILIYGNVAWLLVVNFYYGVPSQLALSSHLLQLEKFTFLGVQKIKEIV